MAQKSSKPVQKNTSSHKAPEREPYRRVILVGSPRNNGRSAMIASEILEACIAEYPRDECRVIAVSALNISPCTGCGACKPAGKKQPLSVFDEEGETLCVLQDDMSEAYDAIEAADEAIIVAPVYFAGPSAQFKAMLDRFQPFFWTDARHGELRPATLHIIGEGHDPFGYDPLVTTVQSALLCAGYELTTIFDWVGCIDADNTIIQEAEQYQLAIEEDYDEELAGNA